MLQRDLRILAEIGRGAEAVVYRAVLNGQMVALKLPYEGAPEEMEQAALRFRREARLLLRARHPGLPEVLELGEWDGRPCLVLEYVEGVSLEQLLAVGPLDEERLVGLATCLAGALHELHRHGLVHRDVKPQNILVGPDGSDRLIDFGLLSPVQRRADDEPFFGSLRYSAPEQTGMLRRAVDGRADLYALGAVLFEAAAGEPLFGAERGGDLARLHLAVEPPPVHERNPAISPAFSAIIAKLLAKEPEERYQSGRGLLGDLAQLDRLNGRLAAGLPLALGQRDRPAELDEVACVGRSDELAGLQAAWHGVLRGQGQVVLVEGEPGVGKSRLVQEFLRQTGTPALLAGKCPAAEPVPFGPLREALDGAIRSLQSLEEAERQFQEDRLRQAAGDFRPLLSRLSVDLAALLGEDRAMPDLAEAPEIFLDGLAGFLLRYAHMQGGAVLFLDDVQWLDEATLGVVRRLVARLEGAPLLLIAAARSDSASRSGLRRFLSEVGEGACRRIGLGPLTEEAVGRLLTAQLGGGEPDALLVQQILLHSGGNPFAIGEYVGAMVEAGILRPQRSAWHLDLRGMESLELPGDVLALLVRRMDSMRPVTLELLSTAALLGNRFGGEPLALLSGLRPVLVNASLSEAVQARLIIEADGEQFAFVHDRVREALLSRLEEETRQRMHQRIAEMLDVETADVDRIYAVARHYAQGDASRRPDRYCQTHIMAGMTAMEQFADEEAYGFLTRARAVAQRFALPVTPDLEEAIGAVATRTGRLAEAQAHLEAALTLAPERLERARLYVRLARVHLWNLDNPSSWRAIMAGFRTLRRRPPGAGLWELPKALAARAISGLVYRLGGGRSPASGPEAERLRTLFHLYEQATEAALFEGQSILVLAHMLRSLQVGYAIGPSGELALALTNIGLVLANVGLGGRGQRYFRAAEQMAAELGDRQILARVFHLEALAYTFRGEVRLSEELHRRYLQEYRGWLRTADYLNGVSDLVWSLCMRGYLREGWGWMEVAMRRADLAGATTGAMRIHWWPHAYAAPTLAALGEPARGKPHLDQVRELVGENRSSWEIYCSQQLLFLLEQGELGLPMDETIATFHQRDLHPHRPVPHHQRFYIFQGYARWAQWRAAAGAKREERLAQLGQAVGDLKRVKGHPILQAHAQVIRAAFAWASGDRAGAERILVKAEALAHASDNPWAQYEALRLRAYIALGAGDAGPALRYSRLALTLAAEHGWAGRARQLRAELPVGQAPTPAPGSASGTDRAGLRLRRHLDALLQVSLAAAGSQDPVGKARATLKEIARILGAERAFLFLAAEATRDLRFAIGLDGDGQDLNELTGYSRTVVETVAIRQQPVVVQGTEEAVLLGSASIIAHDLRSIIAAPLLMQERLIGVVYVDNRLARGIFSEEDVAILLALANHIAIAMQSSQLAQLEVRFEAERRQRRLAETMRNLAQALNASLTLQDVVDRFLEILPQIIPYDSAAIFLQEGEQLQVVSTRGMVEMELQTFPAAEFPPIWEVLRTRQPLLIGDLAEGSASLPIKEDRGGRQPIRTWIGVPLISHRKVAGVVALCRSEPHAYGQHEVEIAHTLAGPVGMAIENALLFEELRRAAVTDELTGVANRRHLIEAGERELMRARRSDKPFAVLMLDVDHFKHVNDRYGHGAGDEVLRRIVRRCQRILREVDTLGRYGGEEFAILLPETDLVGAVLVADRLREAVAGEPVQTDSGPVAVTISIGAAVWGVQMHGLTDLLNQADTALYRAKSLGRNRVEPTPGSPFPSPLVK